MPLVLPSPARRLLPLLFALAALTTACADRPVIWFENQRDQVVTVSIDGDRLLILAPHRGEFLPYSTAAWAWPRRIDVAIYESREHLWSTHMDADDLARDLFTVFIRP